MKTSIANIDGPCEYVISVPQNRKNSKSINEMFETSRRLKVFVAYDPKKTADDIEAIMGAFRIYNKARGNVFEGPG